MKTSVFGLETTFYLLIVSKLISLPFQRCIIVLIKYLKWLSYVKIKQSAFFTKNASFLLHFLTFSLRISVMNKLRALKIWIFLSQNVYFREKNTKKYLEKVTFLKLGHPMYHSGFVLETDHQPLLRIIGSHKGIPTHTSNRLQRLRLVLLQLWHRLRLHGELRVRGCTLQTHRFGGQAGGGVRYRRSVPRGRHVGGLGRLRWQHTCHFQDDRRCYRPGQGAQESGPVLGR